MAKEDNSKQW